MMKGYFYIAGTVFFNVYGQLVLKWRIVKYGSLPDGYFEKIVFLVKLLFDPYIFSGFISAFVASLFWMAAMTEFDLSRAYPVIVSGLILLTSIFAILFLNETITVHKLFGLLLILLGILLINKM